MQAPDRHVLESTMEGNQTQMRWELLRIVEQVRVFVMLEALSMPIRSIRN